MTIDNTRDNLPEHPGRTRWASPMLTVRVMQVVLWLLVVLGPVAAVVVATRVSALAGRIEAAGHQAVAQVQPDTTGAEGIAELFVSALFGGGEESTDVFASVPDHAPPGALMNGAWLATSTTSLGAREIAPGYLAVTVAAEVVATDPESEDAGRWVPVGTRFYTVGVAETETGWAITGLPSLIAAPPEATAPELVSQDLDGLDSTPDLAEMVPRFVGAFLSGDGELARYTAPTSNLAPVLPPPFVNVEILREGVVDTSEGEQLVTVVVKGVDAAGRAQVLEYSMIVEQRDGRWEVSGLLPAPPLVEDIERKETHD